MKEIATLETVRSAVDALEAQGKSATASAVIAAIGGGSKSTVLKHLREIRQINDEALDDLSSALLEVVKPHLVEIYRQGAKAEEIRVREQTSRLHRLINEQDEQIDELVSEVEIATRENALLEAELITIKTALTESEAKWARQAIEIEKLRANLVATQNEQSARFLDAVEQLNSALTAQASSSRAEAKMLVTANKEETPTQPKRRGRPPKLHPEAKTTT